MGKSHLCHSIRVRSKILTHFLKMWNIFNVYLSPITQLYRDWTSLEVESSLDLEGLGITKEASLQLPQHKRPWPEAAT